MPADNQMHRRAAPQCATSAEMARILGGGEYGTVDVHGGGEGVQPPQAGNREECWCGNGTDFVLAPQSPIVNLV